MTVLTKRDILMALAALGAAAATWTSARAACATGEAAFAAGRKIGEAFLAAHPETDLAALRASLIPNGYCDEALAKLRARAATDFRKGKVFIYRGWRLSATEAQLFALLATA